MIATCADVPGKSLAHIHKLLLLLMSIIWVLHQITDGGPAELWGTGAWLSVISGVCIFSSPCATPPFPRWPLSDARLALKWFNSYLECCPGNYKATVMKWSWLNMHPCMNIHFPAIQEILNGYQAKWDVLIFFFFFGCFFMSFSPSNLQLSASNFGKLIILWRVHCPHGNWWCCHPGSSLRRKQIAR